MPTAVGFFQKGLEEEVGFEPTVPFGTPDFESGTFGHSATLPRCFYCTTGIHKHRISARPAPKFMYGCTRYEICFFLVFISLFGLGQRCPLLRHEGLQQQELLPRHKKAAGILLQQN